MGSIKTSQDQRDLIKNPASFNQQKLAVFITAQLPPGPAVENQGEKRTKKV